MKRISTLYFILISCLAVFFVMGIMFGAVRLKAVDVIKALFAPINSKPATVYIVRSMRLPRVVTAILAGALLSLSGLVFQCVFRNPMADSYVLGVSSSASFTVALFTLLGASFKGLVSMPVAGLLGCFISVFILFISSHKDPFELLLSGMAVNFMFSALTTLLVYLNRRELESIMYWTMGSLSNSTWSKSLVLCIVLIFVIAVLEYKNQTMDILLMDNQTSLSSGVRTETEKIVLLSIACIAVSSVVSFCGVIGFVGLMGPHIVRLIIGPKHKNLIILSALMGSCILLLADIIARSIIPPTELPVGIVTSILGAPLFFIILKRERSWMQ